MIFECEQCGKEILDNEDDYFQGCEHYPAVQLMLRSNKSSKRNEGYMKPKLGKLFIEASLK